MKKRLQIKTMIFLVAFLFSAFFAFGFRHTLHGDDDSQYDAIGWNIAEGNGFSMSTAAPFMPTMNREPAYPYFLGCIYKVFGRNHTIVRFIQVVLFGLTCLVVFDLTADVFDEKISKYAAFLTAISPPLANYASYILSECLFTFLLCLSIFFLQPAQF
jgi:4-amino-4-deoxy-L-arabinose transferase-like glycosyltransferase